jgi:hypothetical protein
MNQDKQNKAKVYIDKAIIDLQEAASILKADETNEIYYIHDLTKKTLIAEKPTFLTAKNFAYDYFEHNNESEVSISKGVTVIKK